MTGLRDLDRELTAYLEARTTNRAPDGLLEAALTQADRTRQRPGWLVLEHWLPARSTGAAARFSNAALVLGILAFLVALAIAIGVIVGSPHRLPPPFGPAKAGLIAFDAGADIVVASPDGKGMTQLTSGPDADIRPTFSPDGTLIAYESRSRDGSWSVIVMNADGQHRVTLDGHLAEVGDLVWSPDSHRVAFGARTVLPGTSYTDLIAVLSGPSHLYVAEADRPGATQLGPPDLAGEEPSWSPDGREIAFKWTYTCCGPKALPDGLWLIGADGSNPRQLWTRTDQIGSGDNALWNTAWSPDGKRLAFLASGNGGALDVYVINADGLSDALNISNSPDDESWPSWSPDGMRIAFTRMSTTTSPFPRDQYPDQYPRIHYSSQNAGTFVVVDADGSHPVLLNGPLVNFNTPVWSPDGTRVLGYVYNPSRSYNDAIALFDPSRQAPPITIPAVDFGSVSWQRLAP